MPGCDSLQSRLRTISSGQLMTVRDGHIVPKLLSGSKDSNSFLFCIFSPLALSVMTNQVSSIHFSIWAVRFLGGRHCILQS